MNTTSDPHNSKIRVLITGPCLEGFSGGIQTHIQNFLAAFELPNKISMKFFQTTKGLYDKESFFFKISRLAGLLIPFCLRVGNSDIVHINSTLDARSLLRDSTFIVLAKAIGKKVLVQFHGGLATEILPLRFGVVKLFFKKCLSLSDNLLLLSNNQKLDFELVFPDTNARVIPNFIDVDKDFKKKFKDLPVFLFLSRLDEEKGVKQIVESAEILTKKGLKFKINVCGNGPLRDWLQVNIYSRNLTDHINYMGFVAGLEKKEVLAESDVMLLPTRHREGFPYTILEAFKYSMPVISSPIGAIPDIIEDGWNGFIINATDSQSLAQRMEYFCKDPEKIKEMGKRGRSLIEERYSINEMKKIFEQTYSGMLRKK